MRHAVVALLLLCACDDGRSTGGASSSAGNPVRKDAGQVPSTKDASSGPEQLDAGSDSELRIDNLNARLVRRYTNSFGDALADYDLTFVVRNASRRSSVALVRFALDIGGVRLVSNQTVSPESCGYDGPWYLSSMSDSTVLDAAFSYGQRQLRAFNGCLTLDWPHTETLPPAPQAGTVRLDLSLLLDDGALVDLAATTDLRDDT